MMSNVQIVGAAKTASVIRRFQFSWPDNWLLIVIMLIGLILRLYALNVRSFWADELDQILYGQGTLAFTLGSLTPPIDYLVTHLIVHYVGQSEFLIRLPDVIWGVLTIYFVYRLGRYWFDRPVAYLAASLLVILPIHIQYSREARNYSLPTLLFVVCLYTCVLALDRPGRRAWLLYSVVSFCALFTHVSAAPFIALLGLWVLLVRRPPLNVMVQFIAATAIPGLLFLLWFYLERNVYLYARTVWVPPFSLLLMDGIFLDMSQYIQIQAMNPARGTLSQAFMDAIRTSVWCVLLLWTLYFYAITLVLRKRISPQFRQPLAGLLIITFGGMIAAIAVDWFTQYFFAPRQFVFFSPFICLVIAATFFYAVRNSKSAILRRLPQTQLINGSAVVFMALCLLVFWTPLMNVYEAPVQDWRDLAQSLAITMKPGDILISPFTHYMGFYQPDLLAKAPPGMLENVNELYSPGYPAHMPKTVEEIAAVAQGHTGLWIVLIGGGSYQRPAALVDFIEANHLIPMVYSQALQIYYYVPAIMF